MDKGREITIEGEGNVQCQGLPPDIKILASPKRGLESERFQQRPLLQDPSRPQALRS